MRKKKTPILFEFKHFLHPEKTAFNHAANAASEWPDSLQPHTRFCAKSTVAHPPEFRLDFLAHWPIGPCMRTSRLSLLIPRNVRFAPKYSDCFSSLLNPNDIPVRFDG